MNTMNRSSKAEMKRTATIIGVLFIIALVLNLVAMAIYGPILSASNPTDIIAARNLVVAGILLDLACVPAIVLIPVMVFPILKNHNERAAIAYVGFRFLEVVYHIQPAVRKLSLINLSVDIAESGNQVLPVHQAVRSNLHAQNEWSTLIYISIFSIGALVFYMALLKAGIIPRLISIWGIAAASLLLLGSLVGFFEILSLDQVMTFFGPPVALNEMTLSIFLILKGFKKENIE